ncbi:PAPLN [Lepeophtheirus salmonis]|uniref:PAPLN n=1 Tax=Lepeophtheirus salmonis TaxID=72036 RepID=A0A7R8CWN6_LEPSM|nr:PAPLN [Lepeophtheirus salmonis]CAF2923822.1 PAPLN [Lepeophtheirus salmonis]
MCFSKPYPSLDKRHHNNPFHKEEELIYLEQGKYNARCRRSDISKFVALLFSLIFVFVVLSVYWELVHTTENVKLPKNCKGTNSQWYFAEEEGTCVIRNLSECDSSTTPFESVEDSPDPGPCRGSMVRFHYNHESRLCDKFIYGGCVGNENNFRTVESCQKKCDVPLPISLEDPPCSIPPYRGPCRGNIQRWYFNNVKKICETFIFGGCLSNKNNFLSLEDCNDKCDQRSGSPSTANKCFLPIDAGNCKASLPRYGFDVGSKKCIVFNYSGCEGNNNRFESLEDCKRNCSGSFLDTEGDNQDDDEEEKKVGEEITSKTLVDCTSDADSGSCKGMFMRYYFDGKQCSTFIYGGCLGNNNNYKSAEKCKEACSGRPTK